MNNPVSSINAWSDKVLTVLRIVCENGFYLPHILSIAGDDNVLPSPTWRLLRDSIYNPHWSSLKIPYPRFTEKQHPLFPSASSLSTISYFDQWSYSNGRMLQLYDRLTGNYTTAPSVFEALPLHDVQRTFIGKYVGNDRNIRDELSHSEDFGNDEAIQSFLGYQGNALADAIYAIINQLEQTGELNMFDGIDEVESGTLKSLYLLIIWCELHTRRLATLVRRKIAVLYQDMRQELRKMLQDGPLQSGIIVSNDVVNEIEHIVELINRQDIYADKLKQFEDALIAILTHADILREGSEDLYDKFLVKENMIKNHDSISDFDSIDGEDAEEEDSNDEEDEDEEENRGIANVVVIDADGSQQTFCGASQLGANNEEENVDNEDINECQSRQQFQRENCIDSWSTFFGKLVLFADRLQSTLSKAFNPLIRGEYSDNIFALVCDRELGLLATIDFSAANPLATLTGMVQFSCSTNSPLNDEEERKISAFSIVQRFFIKSLLQLDDINENAGNMKSSSKMSPIIQEMVVLNRVAAREMSYSIRPLSVIDLGQCILSLIRVVERSINDRGMVRGFAQILKTYQEKYAELSEIILRNHASDPEHVTKMNNKLRKRLFVDCNNVLAAIDSVDDLDEAGILEMHKFLAIVCSYCLHLLEIILWGSVSSTKINRHCLAKYSSQLIPPEFSAIIGFINGIRKVGSEIVKEMLDQGTKQHSDNDMLQFNGDVFGKKDLSERAMFILHLAHNMISLCTEGKISSKDVEIIATLAQSTEFSATPTISTDIVNRTVAIEDLPIEPPPRTIEMIKEDISYWFPRCLQYIIESHTIPWASGLETDWYAVIYKLPAGSRTSAYVSSIKVANIDAWGEMNTNQQEEFWPCYLREIVSSIDISKFLIWLACVKSDLVISSRYHEKLINILDKLLVSVERLICVATDDIDNLPLSHVSNRGCKRYATTMMFRLATLIVEAVGFILKNALDETSSVKSETYVHNILLMAKEFTNTLQTLCCDGSLVSVFTEPVGIVIDPMIVRNTIESWLSLQISCVDDWLPRIYASSWYTRFNQQLTVSPISTELALPLKELSSRCSAAKSVILLCKHKFLLLRQSFSAINNPLPDGCDQYYKRIEAQTTLFNEVSRFIDLLEETANCLYPVNSALSIDYGCLFDSTVASLSNMIDVLINGSCGLSKHKEIHCSKQFENFEFWNAVVSCISELGMDECHDVRLKYFFSDTTNSPAVSIHTLEVCTARLQSINNLLSSQSSSLSGFAKLLTDITLCLQVNAAHCIMNSDGKICQFLLNTIPCMDNYDHSVVEFLESRVFPTLSDGFLFARNHVEWLSNVADATTGSNVDADSILSEEILCRLKVIELVNISESTIEIINHNASNRLSFFVRCYCYLNGVIQFLSSCILQEIDSLLRYEVDTIACKISAIAIQTHCALLVQALKGAEIGLIIFNQAKSSELSIVQWKTMKTMLMIVWQILKCADCVDSYRLCKISKKLFEDKKVFNFLEKFQISQVIDLQRVPNEILNQSMYDDLLSLLIPVAHDNNKKKKRKKIE